MSDTIVPPSNNIPYIIAVVVMMVVTVVAIVVLSIAIPDKDNTNLIALILGLAPATTLSLLAFMKAQETHLSVNSRLDGFMANAKSAARAEGVVEGQKNATRNATENKVV